MSGIGPVEPVNGPEADESHDVIGTDAPRLGDGFTNRLSHRLTGRWGALPPRTRRAVRSTGVIVVAVAGVVLLPTAGAPDRADPPQPRPYPANVTSWEYLGRAAAPTTPASPDSRVTSGLFYFAVSVDHGPPVTVRVDGAAFPGLTAHATPERSLTVHAGTPLPIAVEISVSDCSGLPVNADLPFLDVTLRNTRAIQRHSFIFDGGYARDLSELLHGACGPATLLPGPRPTGSAGSQNAD
ncbi:hypothetical protein [Streptomyces pseudovenezuelae]|uniref:Tat pathway signal sequence domain protein n=1 Tax=Streptomyces pseudovenezuelae TaxID=67350 RepID=A0ABT6LKW1_9ACTN|nr:hypothetical protein [Streptomyces pseudovenezuelae]MDH6216296.1 hypothetical protein [Streptomyces pseudovenezuelae]